jgi:ferredoxin
MAVMITTECISCGTCIDVCPVMAIVDDSDNPVGDVYYVKPEKCIECVNHAPKPQCADNCPTEGAIVWDMPYTEAFNDYYVLGHEEGRYQIREHKSKGIMSPAVKAMPYVESLEMSAREAHANVGE